VISLYYEFKKFYSVQEKLALSTHRRPFQLGI